MQQCTALFYALKGGEQMQIEIRNAGRSVHISGYVNAVERESRVLPKAMSPKAKSAFVEKVSAGAFGKAIAANSNIRMLFNHEREIGSVKGGELKLREDNIGLYAEADITDPETVSAAKRGELRGWSFGFINPVDTWEDYNGIQRRSLQGFDLDEVSILTKVPAYYGTSVEVRGMTGGEVYKETRSTDDAIEKITDDAPAGGEQKPTAEL